MEASTRRKITGGSVIARSTLRMEMASAQEPPKAEKAEVPCMSGAAGSTRARPSSTGGSTAATSATVPSSG